MENFNINRPFPKLNRKRTIQALIEYAKDEMVRVEELESAKVEIQKVTSNKTISKKMFKVV